MLGFIMPQTGATGAWIRQVSQRPKKAAPLMAPSRTESRPYFAIWYVFSAATFLPDSTVRPNSMLGFILPQTGATGAWIRQVSQRPKKAAPLMAPSRTESRPYFGPRRRHE